MDLYVANTTKQHHDFVYRALESVALRTQRIPVGMQVKISGNLSTPEIEYILKQHQRYGMYPVSEIDTAVGYISLLYSIDKPIPTSRIEQAIRYNDGVLTVRGKKIREESAIADSVRLEKNIEEGDLPASLRQYEASIVEENPQARNASDPIAEGVRVTRLADPDGRVPPPARESRNARKAARRAA